MELQKKIRQTLVENLSEEEYKQFVKTEEEQERLKGKQYHKTQGPAQPPLHHQVICKKKQNIERPLKELE